MILDVLLEIFSVDGGAKEQALESVAAAAREDLELVFLTNTRSSNGDVDVVHQRDGGTCKDPDGRVRCELRCEIAVEFEHRYREERDGIER